MNNVSKGFVVCTALSLIASEACGFFGKSTIRNAVIACQGETDKMHECIQMQEGYGLMLLAVRCGLLLPVILLVTQVLVDALINTAPVERPHSRPN